MSYGYKPLDVFSREDAKGWVSLCVSRPKRFQCVLETVRKASVGSRSRAANYRRTGKDLFNARAYFHHFLKPLDLSRIRDTFRFDSVSHSGASHSTK